MLSLPAKNTWLPMLKKRIIYSVRFVTIVQSHESQQYVLLGYASFVQIPFTRD